MGGGSVSTRGKSRQGMVSEGDHARCIANYLCLCRRPLIDKDLAREAASGSTRPFFYLLTYLIQGMKTTVCVRVFVCVCVPSIVFSMITRI